MRNVIYPVTVIKAILVNTVVNSFVIIVLMNIKVVVLILKRTNLDGDYLPSIFLSVNI